MSNEKIISKESVYKAVGSCPICGKDKPWLNDIPLTAFCWGEEGKEHGEVRRIVPSPFQIYGQVGNTRWRRADGKFVKSK